MTPDARRALRDALEEALREAPKATTRANARGMAMDAHLARERLDVLERSLERQGYTVRAEEQRP